MNPEWIQAPVHPVQHKWGWDSAQERNMHGTCARRQRNMRGTCARKQRNMHGTCAAWRELVTALPFAGESRESPGLSARVSQVTLSLDGPRPIVVLCLSVLQDGEVSDSNFCFYGSRGSWVTPIESFQRCCVWEWRLNISTELSSHLLLPCLTQATFTPGDYSSL